jgi:hypothetical protein
VGKPVLLQSVRAEDIFDGNYNELGLIMESGLQSRSRQLKSNPPDTIRRSRNKPKTLSYHSPSFDTQTEEAEYSRPNLKTNTQGTTLRTRSRGAHLVKALRCKPRRSRVGWNFSLTVRPQYGAGVDSTPSCTDCLEI